MATENDIMALQKAGYSPQDIQNAMEEYAQDEQLLRRNQQGFFPVPALYNENLIKWQLELNDLLDKAEHILKEDIVTIEEGNLKWKPNPHPENRIFNDYGVCEILRILTLYVNRNTILSDYEPKEINNKVYDFGKEVNDLVYMKYELMGLDNQQKRKNYPMLIREIVDIVHSTYKRALYGGEKNSLRTARQISQTEQLMPMGSNVEPAPFKERGLLNPFRYIVGKYK